MTEALMRDTVYLLDANVLIALTNAAHVHHGAARTWLAGAPRWATTPMTEAAFLRLQVNPAVVGQSIAFPAAQAALRALRASPKHVWLVDDSTLAEPTIPCSAIMGHRQITDFHLTNLAARTGAVLATFDTGLVQALGQPATKYVHLISG